MNNLLAILNINCKLIKQLGCKYVIRISKFTEKVNWSATKTHLICIKGTLNYGILLEKSEFIEYSEYTDKYRAGSKDGEN